MSSAQHRLRSSAWLAAAGLVLLAFFAPAVARAWTSPVVTALCAPDADHYEFTVTLAQESNENFDWSFGMSGPWTTVAGHAGDNDLVVVRGTGDLWVRWTSDQGLMAHATPNGTLCASPSPSATAPVESESLPPTASPAPSASPTGSVLPTASSTATASPTASPAPTASPTASPTGSVLPTASSSASASPTPPVQSESLAPTPSPSPVGSVLGETGRPTITPPPTDSASSSAASGSGWGLLLLAAAALLAVALTVTPSRRKR